MLLMYDYYSLVIIFGVKYDLGLSDFVLDEKYLWVFWKRNKKRKEKDN